jgi:hypothetical protein
MYTMFQSATGLSASPTSSTPRSGTPRGIASVLAWHRIDTHAPPPCRKISRLSEP